MMDIYDVRLDKFEEKEMMEKRPFTKHTRYGWLINYIPETIKDSGR